VFGGWFGDLPYAIMTSYMGYESTEAAQAAAPWFNGVTLTLNGEPLSLNPLVNPIPFLIISLGMGLIHIVGGMAVKFYILCREGKVWSAIFDVGSYWILFAGIGVVFLYQTVGLGLIIAGVALIVLTQGRAKKNIFAKFIFGLKGLYDLISYASDLLSYSRILALGLAAGVMAQVFNLLATLGGPTVPGFILLIFVMLIGHGLNLAINVLGSFVHTCRLQYLEFFSRFYEDGGSPFKPALTSDKFSTVEKDPEENTALTPKK
jgi:V/A-type H+-transporting ATPase subunit I